MLLSDDLFEESEMEINEKIGDIIENIERDIVGVIEVKDIENVKVISWCIFKCWCNKFCDNFRFSVCIFMFNVIFKE